MLPLRVLRVVSRFLPALASGRAFHRRALAAHAAGADADAERWFETAAALYREDLAIESLARLRVHQLMVRARARGAAAVEGAAMIEIVRRLNRLDMLETLSAPFELADARTVLAQWIEHAEMVPAAGVDLLQGGALTA